MNLGDPCPCRSGSTARECCLATGVQQTKQHLPPARPATGHSHPKCFARRLENWGQHISGEHYLSRSVLAQLEKDGGVFTRGAKFSPQGRRLPLSALQSNVLCREHNADLSALDAIAGTFFAECNDTARQLSADSDAEASVLLVNGYDLERWFLKVLCGLVAGGIMHDVPKSDVRDEWVGPLFGVGRLPGTAGLYVSGQLGTTWRIVPDDLRSSPLFASTRGGTALAGLKLALAGLEFTLLAFERPAKHTGTINDDGIHRPGEICVRRAGVARRLVLDWGPLHTTRMTLECT